MRGVSGCLKAIYDHQGNLEFYLHWESYPTATKGFDFDMIIELNTTTKNTYHNGWKRDTTMLDQPFWGNVWLYV